MYKIDFINEQNTIAHTLTLESGLDDINISAEKITGSDFFSKEPRRVEFSHPINSWIKTNMLNTSGNIFVHEHWHYMSRHRVRFYIGDRNQEAGGSTATRCTGRCSACLPTPDSCRLFFTGFTLTNFITYDEQTETVSFIAYDYLKALPVYSNEVTGTGTPNSTIINVFDILRDYVNAINTRRRLFTAQMPATFRINDYIPPAPANRPRLLTINASGETFYRVPFAQPLGEFGAGNAGSVFVRVRFKTINGVVCFQLYMLRFLNPDHKIILKTYAIYNRICVAEDPNLSFNETINLDTVSTTNPALYAQISDFTGNVNRDQGVVVWSGNYSAVLMSWTPPVTPFAINLSLRNENMIPTEQITLTSIQNAHGQNRVDLFQALKAFLVLHNLTINCDETGTFTIVNKDNRANASPPIHIDTAGVIEFKLSRKNSETPDTSILDCLMGDTTTLKNVINSYYNDFFSQVWELTATLLLNRPQIANLKLFDVIRIDGANYKITSLKPELLKQTIEITAWRI